MTAQFPDTLELDGEEYAIVGVQGAGLFQPVEHGLNPVARTTSCWRGHVCHYALAGDRLLLKGLEVSTVDAPPPLFGVQPVVGEGSLLGARYEGLNHPVPFTGGVLAGKNFIRKLYVHMGFHPAWKFATVHELRFEAGRLTARADRSEAMARQRKDLERKPLGWTEGPLGEWIENSFRLDYDMGEE